MTPHIVEPLNPDQVHHLPGEKWRDPNELQLWFDGDLGGPEGVKTIKIAPSRRRPVKHSSEAGDRVERVSEGAC